MNASNPAEVPRESVVLSLIDAASLTGTMTSSTRGPIGRIIGRLLGLGPRPTPARLDIEAISEHDERWTRTIGTRSWTTVLSMLPDDRMVEQSGPLTLHFDLAQTEEITELRLSTVRVGPIEVPRMLTGRVAASAYRSGATVVDWHGPRALGSLTYRFRPDRTSDGEYPT